MDDLAVFPLTDFRGGLSPEANRGPRGAYYGGYGIDIRSGDNTLKCNQAMKKDSSTTVTDLVLVGFRASDGNQYAFGDTGKIYRKIGTGAWALAFTDADGKITGAAEFRHNNGSGSYVPYIVYATQTHLKKILLSTAGTGTWASTTTVGDFLTGSASYPHSMRVAAGSLMVCDSEYTAILDYEAAFNNGGLNIATGNNGYCMHERNDAVVIGTSGSADQEGYVFTWDGFADSWLMKRPAGGSPVNAMIPLEGGMLLQVGTQGALRFWNYDNVSPLTRTINSGYAYPGGICEYNTIPHFGMNGGTQNGIYSIGRFNKNDVVALNLEYIPSHGKLTGTTIAAVWKDGTDLYCGWKDGTTYGIDVIDHSNKAVAVWETLENDLKRPDMEKVVRILKLVAKDAIPTGCTVTPKIKATRDSDWVALDSEDGETTMIAGDIKRVFNAENMGEVFQIQLTLTPSGNTGPEIAGVIAMVDQDNNL
jgi:hypothetical protein